MTSKATSKVFETLKQETRTQLHYSPFPRIPVLFFEVWNKNTVVL